MKFKVYSRVLVLAVVASLSACSSGGGDSADTSTTTAGTTTAGTTTGGGGSGGSIVGLWDWTETFGTVEDVIYLEILADGRAIEWDYDGDTFDQGQNCYYKFEGPFVALGNNQYTFDGVEATVVRVGNSLSITVFGGTSTLPAITSFTSAGFNEC